jgi:hypothetical protein
MAYTSKHRQFVVAYVLARQNTGFKLSSAKIITPLQASVYGVPDLSPMSHSSVVIPSVQSD